MRNPWHPGVFARLPWASFAALLGAICGVAGSIGVLVVSDGIPITRWSFQPTVYLSILSTITNIMVHYALADGVTTAWWTKALKPDTRASELHQYWKTGNSLLAALTSGRGFNLVALASIIVAVSPINGPLLQRASRVTEVDAPATVALSIAVAPKVPSGYTGIVEGRGYVPSFFNQAFTPVVNDFYDRSDISINSTGCQGTCSTIVVGAGFAINCSSYETLFNATVYDPPNTQFDTNQTLVAYGVDAFESFFNWFSGEPGNLYIDVQYKPVAGCEVSMIVRNCSLSPATVQYNAIVDGTRSTISLPEDSSIYDDAILSHYNITEEYQSGNPTTIGGLYLALANRFNSWANFRFTGAIGYTISTSGVTANQFVNPNSTADLGYSCNLTFSDPTDNLIANARELMFRTAIAAANSSDLQSVPAIQVATIAVYQSHYRYLALASGLTLLAILIVIPTFFGYWHLGRHVSMSPLEIAKAFNAPLLSHIDSNAEAEQLIHGLGEVEVRYGVVSTGIRQSESDGFVTKQNTAYAEINIAGSRLEIARSNLVVKPEEGWQFAG